MPLCSSCHVYAVHSMRSTSKMNFVLRKITLLSKLPTPVMYGSIGIFVSIIVVTTLALFHDMDNNQFFAENYTVENIGAAPVLAVSPVMLPETSSFPFFTNIVYADDDDGAPGDTHDESSDTHTNGSDVHSENSTTHCDASTTHAEDSESHEGDSNTHTGTSNTHETNSDNHNSISTQHTSTSTTHSGFSSLHAAASDTHGSDSATHSGATDVHFSDSNQHSAATNTHLLSTFVHHRFVSKLFYPAQSQSTVVD